jgi:succinyl-CoA synthetase beta subunit
VTLDDNAAFRHPEWEEFAGSEVEDERETRAKERGLNYIGLQGSVGIIANGAGLAMSTLDVVNQCGGSGGQLPRHRRRCQRRRDGSGSRGHQLRPGGPSILVNIFGGITRVDEVAKGVLEALDRVEISSPIVLRLDGTNAVEGREILADHLSDRLVAEPTMLDAARRAVAANAGGQS